MADEPDDAAITGGRRRAAAIAAGGGRRRAADADARSRRSPRVGGTVRPPPSPRRRRRRAAGAAAVARCRPGRRARRFDELGVVGWFRARLDEAPIRPDRSATLRREGGGRLDRLDLWLLVLLVVGTLGLRTFRLAEPYQMHFDEVYHARTATEFLQAWRYGLSHDIYEWTHPHLAKYAMAGGHRRCGARTTSARRASSACPVVAAAVEPRRDDEAAPGDRAGERLHVATGTEIRTYDLATRELDLRSARHPAPRRWRSTTTGNQLVVGYDDGRLATLDLDLDRPAGWRRPRRRSSWSTRRPSRRRTCS